MASGWREWPGAASVPTPLSATLAPELCMDLSKSQSSWFLFVYFGSRFSSSCGKSQWHNPFLRLITYVSLPKYLLKWTPNPKWWKVNQPESEVHRWVYPLPTLPEHWAPLIYSAWFDLSCVRNLAQLVQVSGACPRLSADVRNVMWLKQCHVNTSNFPQSSHQIAIFSVVFFETIPSHGW